MSAPEIGNCRDCRFWNGKSLFAAPCFKITGLPGYWTDLPSNGAAFLSEEPEPGSREHFNATSYLVTGPEFGCALFEEGKPRYWGDSGE